MRASFALALLSAVSPLSADVSPKTWGGDASGWVEYGNPNAFAWSESGIAATWDSSKPNSFFYHPLGITLTTADDFRLTAQFQVSDIVIGTTEGKPYTFQIAFGLINMADAFDPELFRGAGVNSAHGPRNLVEFAYFPDSGFGATVSPTLASGSNQIVPSLNFPLELEARVTYRVEMTWTAADRTLRTTMHANGELFGVDGRIKDIKLGDSFTGFRLDALSVASYSDEGQSPPQFAGSVLAHGTLTELSVTVWHRPTVTIHRGDRLGVSFETERDWEYIVEQAADLRSWSDAGDPVAGTGEVATIHLEHSAERGFFRVRAHRR